MEYCKLCNNYVLHLARHIKKDHKNHTLQQYYDLYLKNLKTMVNVYVVVIKHGFIIYDVAMHKLVLIHAALKLVKINDI